MKSFMHRLATFSIQPPTNGLVAPSDAKNRFTNPLDASAEGAEGTRLLGEAVQACRAALEVRTREALPQHWAMTQNNLAIALEAMGDREAGEEQQGHWRAAEQAWLAALEIYTQEAMPYHHGVVQENLELLRKKLNR